MRDSLDLFDEANGSNSGSDQLFYYINLDERGEFYADVRNSVGDTLFEIDTEELAWLVDAGYMQHGRNLEGLADYLEQVGIMGNRYIELVVGE